MGDHITFSVVRIEKSDEINVILGQSHFIKSAEDLAETVAVSVPGAKYGIVFSEASGDCLLRSEGNDLSLINLAQKNAGAIAAGHTFILFLRDCYPMNVLTAIKNLPVVCTIFCATANPVDVIVAETALGRGIMGVIDGARPRGLECPADMVARRAFLRKIGYKFT